jgi:hypothetical protein
MGFPMDRKSDKPKSGSEAEIVVFSVTREAKCTECDSDRKSSKSGNGQAGRKSPQPIE